MDLLLRELDQEEDGSSQYRDTEVSADDITLGSQPDQIIQIIGTDVEAQHAILKKSGKAVQLSCRRGCRVLHQGREVSSATLSEGDVLEIGNNRISVIAAPPGFDLALEISRATDIDSSVFEGAYRTRLTQTWLAKRWPSWVGLLLVLVMFLGLPLAQILLKDEVTVNPVEQGAGALLPSDDLWLSGPLHPAHKVAIGNDCAACHATLFQMVPDNQCLNCHEGVADHAASDHLMQKVGLDEIRCATCHREHNEPTHITVDADSLCTDCHATAQQTSVEGVELAEVTGFDVAVHPAFKVELLTPIRSERGTGAVFDWRPRRSPAVDARESSNLKFPHDLHLNEDKVRDAATDAALECANCHNLSADDEHFAPVTMEAQCRNCHELTFDPSDPQRQLPHGNPVEVVLAMEGHYMLKYADPKARSKTPTRRRLPGRSNAREEACKGSAYECARQKTAQAVANQFTRSGCITCHEVGINESADLYSRYQVLPVRLNLDYYPWARFDHRSHLTQENRTSSDACLSCHSADVSAESSEVLIPDIDNCVACHGDASVNRNLILHCVECHSFHLETGL